MKNNFRPKIPTLRSKEFCEKFFIKKNLKKIVDLSKKAKPSVNQMVSKETLAKEAIHVEQNMIQENVGSQDQTAAAYGGLNLIHFKNLKNIIVEPVLCSDDRIDQLQGSLLLYFSGFQRYAEKFASAHINQVKKKESDLKDMIDIVDEGLSILKSKTNINANY